MRLLPVTAAAVAALAASSLALAQPRRDSQDVSIQVRPTPITFGQSTKVSGMLRQQDRAGKRVDLQSRPYGARSFNTIANATLTENGRYEFDVRPDRNTGYRVIARTSPPVTSAAVEANVRFRVTFRMSTYRPRRCRLVRFSGSVLPEHDGRRVYLQRQLPSSRWRSVARTTLRDAGSRRSAYSRRVRVCRDGTFRARVVRDADHATGDSPTRDARVR